MSAGTGSATYGGQPPPWATARLIDLEGVTVGEMAVPGDRPPHYLERACTPKIAAMVDPEEPIMLTIKRIEYKLERRDGGGTYIYRRTTGPWG